MNKYSSKAIKTAATVGMSLAMVLSAAAPVMATAAPATAVCTDNADTDAKCKTIFFDLSEAINEIGLDSLNVESEATIDSVKNTKIISAIILNKEGLERYLTGSDYTTFRKWITVTNKIAADKLTDENSKGMFSTEYFTNTGDASDMKTLAETGGLINYYMEQLDATGATSWSVDNLGDKPAIASDAVKAFEKMQKWIEDGDYDRLDDILTNRFDKVYNALEDRTADYVVSDEKVTDVFVAAWTTVLEQDLTGDKGDALKFSTADAAKFKAELGLAADKLFVVDRANKSAIKARIQAIKDAPNYYRVKTDSSVQDIIDQYNDLLGNITDLKDVLKSDSYKAFTSTKVERADDGEKETLRTTFKGFTPDAKSDTDKKKATELAKALTADQYDVLKALKEDVLDEVFNFETKKVGNYHVDKSGWVDGFTGSSTVGLDFGTTDDYLLKLVDTKEGTFGIDVVLNHLEEFVEAWDAVTTDIAKLTPANIKGSDKATLEAAEDALYEMTGKGKYVGNLTKEQKKEIRKIQTKLDNLREAFDNLGVTNVAGWYDMGNGNWGYNNEDGTPAAYKWVASGSNWYMIKDGKMLRNSWIATDGGRWYYVDNAGKMVSNQSVDGCWINSYGVYMSPSYNG